MKNEEIPRASYKCYFLNSFELQFFAPISVREEILKKVRSLYRICLKNLRRSLYNSKDTFYWLITIVILKRKHRLISTTFCTESILMQRLKDGEVKDADKCEPPINEQNTLTPDSNLLSFFH